MSEKVGIRVIIKFRGGENFDEEDNYVIFIFKYFFIF